MELFHQRLHPHTTVGDLIDLGAEDMLQYDPYEDVSQNVETLPSFDEKLEATLEWKDQYVKAEILLLVGEKMARG